MLRANISHRQITHSVVMLECCVSGYAVGTAEQWVCAHSRDLSTCFCNILDCKPSEDLRCRMWQEMILGYVYRKSMSPVVGMYHLCLLGHLSAESNLFGFYNEA